MQRSCTPSAANRKALLRFFTARGLRSSSGSSSRRFLDFVLDDRSSSSSSSSSSSRRADFFLDLRGNSSSSSSSSRDFAWRDLPPFFRGGSSSSVNSTSSASSSSSAGRRFFTSRGAEVKSKSSEGRDAGTTMTPLQVGHFPVLPASSSLTVS